MSESNLLHHLHLQETKYKYRNQQALLQRVVRPGQHLMLVKQTHQMSASTNRSTHKLRIEVSARTSGHNLRTKVLIESCSESFNTLSSVRIH